MTVELNHIIIPSHDKKASAQFLADVLGIPVEGPVGPFLKLRLDNGVTLDYLERDAIRPHHCAFLVGDDDFDAAFSRIREAGLPFFADPGYTEAGEINHRWGGRGVYFRDPDGHSMELLTRAPTSA